LRKKKVMNDIENMVMSVDMAMLTIDEKALFMVS